MVTVDEFSTEHGISSTGMSGRQLAEYATDPLPDDAKTQPVKWLECGKSNVLGALNSRRGRANVSIPAENDPIVPSAVY